MEPKGADGGAARGAPACHAPFTSLYLDQRGFARVCPVNNAPPLGNVAHEPLLDIWRGPRAQALREEFLAGGWGSGCEVCSWQATSTSPEQAYARLYDESPVLDAAPAHPQQLELALSNRCNLRCVMCSGDQSSAIRAQREHFPPLPDVYPERFFAELPEVLAHLRRAKFLGGEPFLVPAHHRVFDLLVEGGHELPIHVTTNGTVWNPRVERVLEALPTSFAISVDGIRPETVARVRVGADLPTILANLDRFQAHTEARGTYLSLTYCLMTENWEEFGEFLCFAEGRDLDVFVNTVTTPGRLSLYRLPRPRLEAVLGELERQDEALRGRLRRNKAVWDDQLDRLRGRLELAERPPSFLRAPGERWTPVAVAPPSADADRRVLRAWTEGGPTSTLVIDGEDRVRAVDPAGEGFLHLPTDVLDRTFDEVAVLLASFYGRRTTVERLVDLDDLQDRIASYETADSHVEVRSRVRPTRLDDGEEGLRLVVGARYRTPSAVS